MFGVNGKPSARAFDLKTRELKPLLSANKSTGEECHYPGEIETQVNMNRPVFKASGDNVDRKNETGIQPRTEDQVDGISAREHGLFNSNILRKNPASVNESEPIEDDEILRIGSDLKIGSGYLMETDAKQMKEKDRNYSSADETEGESADVESDNDEPVNGYQEPQEMEIVDDPSQTDSDPTTVTCFGRSPTLQKKVDELSFLIHYHSVEKMTKILDEESEENQAKLLVLRDKDGLPCLIKAIKRQSLDCLKPLLEKFEQLSASGIFDRNGIDKLDAIKSNDRKNLFHIGAEIATDRDIIDAIEMCPLKEEIADMTDCCNATPLIVACQRQNHQMAVRLVSYKAKIDRVDKDGNSPIYLAAANGSADLLKLFLVHGSRDSKDFWSLISNDKFYRGKGTILQAILESENLDTVRVCTDNEVLGFGLIRRCLEEELVKDPHFLHKICRTPLVDLVEMAIHYDKSLLNGTDDKGMTPLMTAALAGQFEVVKLILDHPCGQNTVPRKRKSDQQTALMIACVEGHHKIAKHIMKTSDVRLEDLDSMKRNVFHHAAKHSDVLKALVDVCSKMEKYKNFKECLQKQDDSGYVSLHLAAVVGAHTNVKLLLENGVPYDTPSSRVSRHALHYAACTTLSTVKALVEFVEANNDVNAMKKFIDAADSRSQTSLHLAASLGKWRTVSYLLKKGATIKCDHEKETALHHASASGCIKTVKCILNSSQSFVNHENRVGETAAMFASVQGNTEILLLLLKNGARLWAKPNSVEKRITCLDWAVFNKQPDTAAAILEVKDWKEAMEKSSIGADGLLAEMVKNMPNVALKVLDKCTTMPSNIETRYNFFCLQTVEEVTSCGRKEQQVVSMQAIESMVNRSRDECLRHAVVQNFLNQKWMTRVRKWWLFSLFLYTVFIVSLTTYIGLVRKGAYSAEQPGVVVAVGICFGFASLCIMKELFQLVHKKLKYFRSFTMYVELVMYICVFIFLPNAEKTNLQLQAGAIAVFLGWINFIWFLKRFPAYGIYVIMVKKIFVTFLKVFVPVGFFIMAFAMTFFVLMPHDPGFQTIPRALITSFAMMVGEIDYRDTYLEQEGANFALIMVFLVVFLILMTILLMNLLTGLAVGDTGAILERSKAEKRIQQALLIVDMEKYLKKYPCLGASYMEPFTESPKKPTGLAKVIRNLKEQLFPNVDGEGADEKLSGCQCAALKEQMSEIKTTLEAVQKYLMENKQDRPIRRTSELIRKFQRKDRGSV